MGGFKPSSASSFSLLEMSEDLKEETFSEKSISSSNLLLFITCLFFVWFINFEIMGDFFLERVLLKIF